MINKLLLAFIMVLAVLPGVFSQTRQTETALRRAPFSRGMNFSGWFEGDNAENINFTMYTEQDFADVKKLGADVIRLPIKMHSMTNGAPDYTLDPLLLKFLDMAVDWAEKYGLYIIIDNHSFHPVNATSNDIDKVLLPVWAQIARRYKDRGDFVVYEILNEPHGISDRRWGEVQGAAIETIRRYDQRHAIIVGGTDYNSIGKLSALPKYSDSNLIYTFHFYDPFLFTHQGASWSDPLMVHLSGVPFPYERRRMPRLPARLRGTWIENNLNNDYPRDSSSSKLTDTLDKVVAFSRERNVPVFCGEFGVYIPNSPPEDRVKWYEFVAGALDSRNIARTSWDYYGSFGIFNTERRGDINHDLNVAVVRAMGFTPPAQSVRRQDVISAGFAVYEDYTDSKYAIPDHWGDGMEFSLYDTNSAEGEFAIRWANAAQYNTFRFFLTYWDFSRLVSENYFLEFKARAERPVSFDVRFVNSESSSSIPWRMRYTINGRVLPPDGKWHTIRIPLSAMEEHGAWVNLTQQWVNPRGKFSWQDVRSLEFVAEHSDMKGLRVWFDSIRITR